MIWQELLLFLVLIKMKRISKLLEYKSFWFLLTFVTFVISLIITLQMGSPSIGLIGGAFSWIAEVLDKIGYIGIFFVMLLEYIIAPIPSEMILPFAGFLVSKDQFYLPLVLFSATFASLAGSLLLYFIGDKGGRKFIEKYGKYFLLDENHLHSAEKLFAKYGGLVVFACRLLPGIRTIVSFPAGVGKMNKIKFSLYTLLGSFLWNFSLIWIGILLGDNWGLVSDLLSKIEIPILSATVVVFLWFIQKGRNGEHQ